MVVQSYSVANFKFTTASSFVGIQLEWAATMDGKTKTQEIKGDTNDTLITYGDAYFAVPRQFPLSLARRLSITAPAINNNAVIYDKKAKAMVALSPRNSTDVVLALVGVTLPNSTNVPSLHTIKGKGMPVWGTILIVIGCVAVIVLLIAIAVGGYMFYEKRKRASYEAI